MIFKSQKLNDLQSQAAVSYDSKSGTFDEVTEVLILEAYRQGVRDLESQFPAIASPSDVADELLENNLYDGASKPFPSNQPLRNP